MKLIMTRGLPASGKTTWALQQVDKDQGHTKRVNKDDLRAMADNGKWSEKREDMIRKARDILAGLYLSNGCDVIVDDTNFHPIHEVELKKLAAVHGAEFEVKDFYVPVGEAIERDAKRTNAVGTKVIRQMWSQYVCQPAPELIDAPFAIICDIDGTLAHMKNRGPFDWKKVGNDTCDGAVAHVLETYKSGDAQANHVKIILFSGRDGSCRPETEAWLHENAIPYDRLYMREADDNRKDYLIKEELYEAHIKGKYNVLFVLDDRQQVVDRWRELGLKCLQVAPGDF